MAPNTSTKPANAMHKFKKDLAKIRKERDPRAAPEPGFENASAHVSSCGQVVKIVKYVRVRPVGRSIFSTMALGFELNKEDPELGMRLGVIEEIADEEAMSVVEKQSEEKRALEEVKMKDEQQRREAEQMIELKRKVDEKGHKEAKELKLRNRRNIVVHDDDEDGLQAAASKKEWIEESVEKSAAGAGEGGETDEDEAYRIKIPMRRTTQKAKAVDDTIL